MIFLTDWIDKNKADTIKIKGQSYPQQWYWQTLPPIEALIFWV